MSEKKDIDRLFREQFKEFEETPPEFIWHNIEDELRQKKKRRVIPFWIRLGGVAAVLLIGTLFTLPYFLSSDDNAPKANPLVLENQTTNTIDNNPENNNRATESDAGTTVVPNNNNAVVTTGQETGIGTKPSNGTNAANAGKSTTIPASRKNNAVSAAFNKPGTALASGTVKTSQGNTKGRNKKGANLVTKEDALASSHRKSVVLGDTDNYDPAEKALHDAKNNNTTDSAYAANNKNTGTDTKKAVVPEDKSAITDNPVIDKTIPVTDQGVVAATVVDTASVKPENELEKILREKEEDKEKEKQLAENGKKEKWNIKPQLAPVFYNSLSQGSPIDGQFAANSKSYNNDLSYGLGVNYAVNDRIKIRSGINTVNLSYATNDIQFYASMGSQTNNLAKSTSAATIVVQTKEAGPSDTNGMAAMTSLEKFNGAMTQKTGYIEVPVEMSYALLNKKFGIELIGGVSTLFLNENNVSVITTQGLSANVGEAQNLNNVHFSTNVGIGFKYQFFKSFEASFEPTFKYQVNTFSRDAGNFKPYFIGLYSGISFSF